MSTHEKSRGQAAAELALLVPLLLLLVLGCLDLGRAFGAWITLINATREGARQGSLWPAATADIYKAAQAEIVAGGLPAGSVTLSVSAPGGMSGGSPIVVSASYNLTLVSTYLLGKPQVAIHASTRMAIMSGGS